MEQSLSRPGPSLPPIVEGKIFNPDDFVDIEDDGDLHDIESTETTSLLKSGLSLSYTESTKDPGKEDYGDFSGDDENDGLEDDEDNLATFRERFGSSIMTDFQASLFLPSVQMSFHSTYRGQSQDFTAKSVTASQIQKPDHKTVSAFHSKSVLISLVEKLSDDRGSSYFLAVWNILPSLLGSALFAMPYVVRKGGFLILIPLVILCVLADVTAKLLIECLYEISPKSKNKKRVRLDLVDIADAVWGKNGAHTVNFLLIFYLVAADIVNLVLLGESVNTIVQPYTTLPRKAITAICAIFVIPTLFIQKLTTLAYLSMLSVLSIIAGSIAVLVIFIEHNIVWAQNAKVIPLWDSEGSLLAISMIFYSIITHSVLSQIEGSMREPKRFNSALHLSYSTSTVVKVIIGLLGCLTFGVVTRPVVVLNIPAFSQVAGIACSVALIGYTIFNFPLNLFVVCALFDSVTVDKRYPLWKKGGKYNFFWLLLTRPIMVGFCLIIAVVVPYFNYLVGIVGSIIGASLVFIFPAIFHFLLKKKKNSRAQAASNILLVAFGVICGLIGLYASVRGLITVMLGGKED